MRVSVESTARAACSTGATVSFTSTSKVDEDSWVSNVAATFTLTLLASSGGVPENSRVRELKASQDGSGEPSSWVAV